MAVQCAALGIINVGGVQDSNEILFPSLASNDLNKLEEIFKTIHNNSDKREEVIQTAFNKAKSHYSHDVVKERFLGVVNG